MSKLMDFRSRLAKRPVIAGLRTKEDAQNAASMGLTVCFYLTGTIFELREIVQWTRQHSQMLFVHVDLIQGVAKDGCGLQLLAEELDIDGILTTKTQLVREAKRQDLLAIQRLFMLDSESLRTGMKILQTSNPDAVEILPALILPNISQRLPSGLPPIIGGGLVETQQELEMILAGSTLAVSTSHQQLWSYQRRGSSG